MTLAKIEYVDYKNGILELSGVDLCDETPILDIKPYVPADRPLKNEIKYADWVLKEAERKYQVIFTDTARSGLLACHGGSQFYSDEKSLQVAIENILTLDVRGIHQNRGKIEPNVEHRATVDGVLCKFTFTDEYIVLVHEILKI